MYSLKTVWFGKFQHRNRRIAGHLLSSLFPRTMLVSACSSPPLSLAYAEMETIDKLASSDVSNHVSLAILTPSQLDNVAPFVATRVIGSLRGIKTMNLFFPLRFFGWRGFTPPESEVMQPAHNLRHATITSGSVGAMIALINRAPALEYLSRCLSRRT